MTGGRVKNVAPYIGGEPFMLTYGDGVSNVNITKLVAYHKNHGKVATVTATQPSGRFGALKLGPSEQVLSFQEKPAGDGSWINGGFFVLEPRIFEFLTDDSSIFEKEPLECLAAEGQLDAYRHNDFWYAMDTLRDKQHLEALWQSGKAPWKVWK
jgi:glucose-1-phosphate cytidylyltransferase